MKRAELVQALTAAKTAAYDAFEKGAGSEEFVKAKANYELSISNLSAFDLTEKKSIDDLTSDYTGQIDSLKTKLQAAEDLNTEKDATIAELQGKQENTEATKELEALRSENEQLKAKNSNLSSFIDSRSLNTELEAFKGNPSSATKEAGDEKPVLSEREQREENRRIYTAKIKAAFATKK